MDLEALSGRKFVKFARRLIYYEGAVIKKMQIDHQQSEDGPISVQAPENNGPTKKMSMSEAMKKYSGEGSDNLDAINFESESAMGGTLFERVTVPSK